MDKNITLLDNYHPLITKALTFMRIKDSAQPLQENHFLHPFITVAREPGSGGAPIAKAVAQRLGFELVDDIIVEEIARSTKRRKAIIQEVDEKSRSMIDDVVHSVLNPEYVDEEKYIGELVRVIVMYAHAGKCVIMGHGANFITPFGRGLHVSITAPLEVRIQRAMDYEGHSRDKAKAVILQVETQRAKFVQQYFHADVRRRNVFDLTLNTTHFPVPAAANIVVEAFKQKFSL